VVERWNQQARCIAEGTRVVSASSLSQTIDSEKLHEGELAPKASSRRDRSS
jgi:hypothetical protein